MKKMTAWALILLLCLGALGVGVAEQAEKQPLGKLTKLGISEEELNAKVEDGLVELSLFSGFRYFDNYNSMISALESGGIAAINIDGYMLGYLLSRSKDLAQLKHPDALEYELGFSMLLREEDAELCDRVSQAIADLKADGTMDALKAKYIDDVIAGNEPEAVTPGSFEGAGTLRVALTGDRPPMDYFSDAGEPIGFNTALVTEVAGRLGMNVEFVSVDTGARAISLATNASDIVFWSEAGNFDNWEKADTEDQPEGTLVTEPYLTSELLYAVRADSPLLGE